MKYSKAFKAPDAGFSSSINSQVQNRVYRKEMATLDAEIAKLERMLENRSSSTSSSQISMIPYIKVKTFLTQNLVFLFN